MHRNVEDLTHRVAHGKVRFINRPLNVCCPYSLKSLPSNFKTDYLVEINLSDSSVETLWSGCQELGSLKHMKLTIRRQCLNHSPWRVSLALKVDNDNDGCRKKRFAVDGDDDGLLV
ncbi:hypothetical protein F2Q68_00025103 [Brassica cretica]|uniref:Uncharacterized protein n=2 Tax=Brassica cretica TaxID=69181 RepID=A0A8S9QWW6_BRACR|nr:hypothetical protein F2Q68_00025103 [Brassica cretica]KAF3556137.1 hypothetical protein F2Q69_00012417 [Brassica cretica]KAF3580777.1 hypothetical protein DY000_02030556 [Brassica cretica]